MCGICGKLNFDGRPVEDEELRRMTATLDHRGPDELRTVPLGACGLGAARLAIIDLDSGSQPVSNEDETVWAAANGEIYNYRELRNELVALGHIFSTKGDTEVLVHAYEEYGPALAERLQGMFAAAIWDHHRRRLVLIRDRLGVKPLFYYVGSDRLVFGSELKALIAEGIPRDIELQGFDDYLTFGYVPGPESIFKGVSKLEPGHYLVCDADGKIELQRYWDLLAQSREPIGDEAQLGREFWELFLEAVRSRLDSDVPLGVLLSGGVDSAAVVMAMRELGHDPIRTFTVGFAEDSFDESPLARMTAQKAGAEHHESIALPEGASIVEEYVDHFDEPYGESSAVPIFYVARFARQHVKVALTGDGGDEMLGGYNTYAGHRVMKLYKRLPGFVSRGLIPWAVRQLPVSHERGSFESLAKRFVSAADTTLEEAHLRWLENIDQESKRALYGDAMLARPSAPPAFRHMRPLFRKAQDLQGINRLGYVDTQGFLRESILTKTDRMTMAHALEARAPFLDYRLWEFALRLPEGLKIKGFERKHLLKKLLKGKAPDEVLHKPKMGFILPLARWFCTDLKELLCDSLTPNVLSASGFFNPTAVQRLIEEHLARKADHSKALWEILVFQLWLNRWGKR